MESALCEFKIDWLLSGRSEKTIGEYSRYLAFLFEKNSCLDQSSVRVWLSSLDGVSTRRMAVHAIRCFGKYLEARDIHELDWWKLIPLPIEKNPPQQTVEVSEVMRLREKGLSIRDRAIIELLWSTGIRRGEMAQLLVNDVTLDGSSILVRSTKGRVPRRVPLSKDAQEAVKHYLKQSSDQSRFGLSGAGISAVLKRLGAPPAHAWRRGWAVQALSNGISQASVMTVAGWKSSSMVNRYTALLAEELAVKEFVNRWS